MRQTSNLVCALACLLIWCSTTLAQDYQPSSASSSNGSWEPPTMQYKPPPSRQAALPASSQKWWPDKPLKQDSNVRPANVEVALPEADHSLANLNATLGENVAKQVTGFLGSASGNSTWQQTLKDNFAGVDVQKMLGSLAIVLGGYFGFVWFARRLGAGGSGKLPSEVLDVVGSAPFGPRKQLQLVRLGSKLLLLLHGPEGTHPIGEITDPSEVEQLILLCHRRTGSRSRTNTQTFKNLMGRLQSGFPSASQFRPGPIVTPQPAPIAPAHPMSASSMQTTAEKTTSELERIVQQLSSVVEQSNGRNIFEA